MELNRRDGVTLQCSAQTTTRTKLSGFFHCAACIPARSAELKPDRLQKPKIICVFEECNRSLYYKTKIPQ